MDASDARADDFRRSFQFLRLVNRYGGGHRATLKALSIVLDGWPSEKPVEICDAGCGDGDLAPVIFDWGASRELTISYRGIDKSREFIVHAKKHNSSSHASFECMDILSSDFPKTDVIILSLVLHHFSAAAIKKVLYHTCGKARHAIIINDLYRSRIAYGLCYLMTLFTNDCIVRKDALLSIKKGFSKDELQIALSEIHNRKEKIYRTWGWRLVGIMVKKTGGNGDGSN